jgi:hypothetical protein
LGVIGPESQGGKNPELIGQMQWPAGTPGNTWQRRRQPWEHLESQKSSVGKTSSLGMLLVRLDIIATTYRSTIFKTHIFSLYCHLCIYVSISLPIYTWYISGLTAGSAREKFEVRLKMTIK